MFAIPGKDPVTLTPAAVARIRALMQGGEVKGLKIGVRKGGCAGMEYTMEHATEIGAHDAVVEREGARVLIAPMAQMFLIGTEIDSPQPQLSTMLGFLNTKADSSSVLR